MRTRSPALAPLFAGLLAGLLVSACGQSDTAPLSVDAAGLVTNGDLGAADAATADAATADAATGPIDSSAQALCVKTINMYRATLGLAAYTRWTAAESCGDGQATSDSMSGTAHGAFGSCGEFAQNECPGWSGPPEQMITACLAQMWAEGPGADFQAHGHYINMSSTKYTTVACGFHVLANGSVWAVQDFK